MKKLDLPDFAENLFTGVPTDLRQRNAFIYKCIENGWKFNEKKLFLFRKDSPYRIEVWQTKSAEIIYYHKYATACKSQHIENADYEVLLNNEEEFNKFMDLINGNN